MNERFKLIASVYMLFRNGDKILLLRRANTGYEDGKYGLVAGHVDGDELLTKAAAREAKEEAGVDIEPENFVLKTVMHRRQEDERIDFFFEVQEWEWFAWDELPEPLFLPMQNHIKQGYTPFS